MCTVNVVEYYKKRKKKSRTEEPYVNQILILLMKQNI